MAREMDYTSPSTQFFYDINKSRAFTKDNLNYINVLSVKQLNTLIGISLLDIFLNANNVIEPHYHQNAAELVYCVKGSADISLFNPFTKQLLTYPISPGQVVNIPQGWWHYEVAKENNTHLLAIFNASTPDVILGSDLLAFTPPNIMAHTYCMDEKKWKEAVKPVEPSTFIGPPKSCERQNQYSNVYFPPHYSYQRPYYYY
ncbi:cupin [Bacillus sp. LL01]|uniref:cupin domain-containing protein n=1 Tax=Bacillus sp. LL01 TaxID=1665556 RepID=UPI00064D2AEF|nr:cupin domain-containing protein [Bacillus sp. LL01]KMJ59446.1 cupin [Bacillus sp. LL01]